MTASAPITQDVHTIPRKLPESDRRNLVGLTRDELRDALIAAGKKVYKKCKACHQVGDGAKNKVGPVLNGIVGAPLGAVDGFKYSKALKAKAEEGAVWDDASLDAFLTRPKKWLKGTKMSFGGLKKEKDRAAIIEFLKSHSN